MDETGLELGTATSETTEVAEEFKPLYQVLAAYARKRHLVPLEDLEPYRDRYVAWDPTGTRGIASTERLDDLFAAIEAAGYDVGLCPQEFIG